MQVQTLKGFRDFLPAEARRRQYVINILRQVFENFGFEPLETPALEYEEILLGKYGEEGDKLMYRFTDNGDRRVALRYDQTVPLARVVAQYGNELVMPFKRYQIQNVWRAENTQKGRFREFLQCDADIVGIDSPLADAEIIACVIKGLEKLGFKNFKVLINDRTIFNNSFYKFEIPYIRAMDKLKKIGSQNVIEELVKSGADRQWAKNALDYYQQIKPTQTLNSIFSALKEMGIDENKYEFSPTLARGMDYYTGLILEIEVEEYPAGSLGGGGRYDKLIGMFAGKDIPAVGFAFGFDRLMEAMEELNLFPEDLGGTKVLITVFSIDSRLHPKGTSPAAGGMARGNDKEESLVEKSLEISSRLRSNNINTEIYLDPTAKLDKQLKYADQKGIPYAIIIGPEEAQSNKIVLKDLKNRTQETLTLDEVIQKLT